MFSAPVKKLLEQTEKASSAYCSSGDAETELLEDLIDAMQTASLKGMTDHQVSAIISQAACQVGVNLFSPTMLDKELDSNDVMAYLRSFVRFMRKADD